jgi:WD40 repeat protein
MMRGKGDKDWQPIVVPATKRIERVKWSPDGNRLLSSGDDGVIWMHDSNENYKVVRKL